MQKTLLIFLSLSISYTSFSQKIEEKVVVIEKRLKKEDKKVEDKPKSSIIKDKKIKTTVIVDGNKVTINGKPVESMKEREIDMLVEEAMDELRELRPEMDMPRENGGPRRIKEFKRSFNLDLKNKALLGVRFTTNENGAVINKVEENSAADKAGLKNNDIITKINTDVINNQNGIENIIKKYNPGDNIIIEYKRDNKTLSTSAILQENKIEIVEMELENMDGLRNLNFEREMPGFRYEFLESNINKPKMGLKIQDIEEGDGVQVLEVSENSNADKAGIKKGDILMVVNDNKIKNVDSFKEFTKSFKEGDAVKCSIVRNGKTEEVTIKFPKKLKTAEL